MTIEKKSAKKDVMGDGLTSTDRIEKQQKRESFKGSYKGGGQEVLRLKMLLI